MKFHENPPGGSGVVLCVQTDRHNECSERAYQWRATFASNKLLPRGFFWGLLRATEQNAVANVPSLRSAILLAKLSRQLSVQPPPYKTPPLRNFLAGPLLYFIRPPYHAGLINGSNGPFSKQYNVASTLRPTVGPYGLLYYMYVGLTYSVRPSFHTNTVLYRPAQFTASLRCQLHPPPPPPSTPTTPKPEKVRLIKKHT